MLDEHLYSLSVNGRILTSVLMLKGAETAYAYGYLKTEGILQPEEIESVMVDDPDISVLTRDTRQVLLPKKTVVSGCGGTASYLDASKLPVLDSSLQPADIPLNGFSFSGDVISKGGFSAAVLAGNARFLADDTGLSQAADKAIGSSLMKKTDLSSAVLVISGKTSADIVRKALFAGIPAVVSKYPATTLAKSMADAGHLTVICEPSL
ncbi:MAG: formate dehydrogenase accessory sulfurtransferase FdhD [Methanocorpusculum sp.]|nr:formate dehydrogenase accessory sulfurtransferase FdhD [Methanocorpusculum sp.]